MRILYLDDHPDVCQNARNKLAALGHQAWVVSTHEEALSILRDPENKVQLVIADHQVGGAEGLNFVLGLPAAFPSTKICVLSPQIARSVANQLTAAGIEFFQKPVLLEMLLREVRVPPAGKTVVPWTEKPSEGPRATGLLPKKGVAE